MKKLILTFSSLILVLSIKSQTPKFQWAKIRDASPWGDPCFIEADVSGNIYECGAFNGTVDFDPGIAVFNLTSASGNYPDIFVSKLDPSGNFLWAERFGGDNDDEAYAIALDALDNVYITGRFSGTVDFDPGNGVFNLTSHGVNADAFILKLDKSGSLVWAKNIGGSGEDYIGAIALDHAGNVYTTGKFSDKADFDPGSGIFNLTSSGADDIFVLKLNNSGDFIWAESMGGSLYDYGDAISVDISDNICIAGIFEGTSDFDPGTGVSNLVAQTGSGDIFIAKLYSSGSFAWAKKIDDSTTNSVRSIKSDASGNIYATGYFFGTADFDLGPGIYNLTSAGINDIFILKLNPNGDFIWAKDIGGPHIDGSNSITLDKYANVYATGYFALTVDFDPNGGIVNLTSQGGSDAFILKLDSGGNFIWVEVLGGIGSQRGNSIIVNASEDIYTCGSFYGTTDFDPDTGVFSVTSANNSIFVHKLGKFAAGINVFSNDLAIGVYPNPGNGLIHVTVPDYSDYSKFEIYNLNGELVYEQLMINPENDIDLRDQSDGLYFFRMIANNNRSVSRMILKRNID